jgi:hypothetical protein
MHQSRLALVFGEVKLQQELTGGGAFWCAVRRARCGSDAAIELEIAVTCMSVERSRVLSFRTRTNASPISRVLPEISSRT